MPRFSASAARWLLLLLFLPPAAAVAAGGARFDHYLLALSVSPAFCEDQPQRKRGFAQCRSLSVEGFKAVPLTLHGLWPSRLDRKHPAYCRGEPRASFCSQPALALPESTRSRLLVVMPGAADCLDRYQWAKHGSCSGITATAYYGASARLTERVNRAIGGEIGRHMGREISLELLRQTLARADPALKDAVSFDCRTPRTSDPAKRRPMLHEVRVHFEIDPGSGGPGRPMPYTRAGVRHYNSGCPGGRAYVDTPLD